MQVFPARKFSERAGFPNAGVRGAFHSHWECLQSAYADHLSSVLILEDDIGFSSILSSLTPLIITQLEAQDWDCVFFGHYKTGAIPDAPPNMPPKEFKFVEWTGEIQGLHFYGVSGRILERLNAHLKRVASGIEGDQETGPMPVDGALNVFRRLNPDVRTLIAYPKLGRQMPSRSDILPGMLDRFRILRPLTSALRNMKHGVNAWRS